MDLGVTYMPDVTSGDALRWRSLPRKVSHKTSKVTDAGYRALRGWLISRLSQHVGMDTVMMACRELAEECAGREAIADRVTQIVTRTYRRDEWNTEIKEP